MCCFKRADTSFIDTFLPTSAAIEITALSSIPQGINTVEFTVKYLIKIVS